jgi:hypothetical protein
MVAVGLAFGSTAGVAFDVKKAIDGTDSARSATILEDRGR